MSDHFGIDFGTTNSAIAWYQKEDSYHRINNIGDTDNRPFPSVVAIDHLTGEVVCGRAAKGLINSEDHHVVKSVKSQLDEDRVWPVAGRLWNAERIAAELFQALARRTQEDSGKELKQAVVAIPIGMPPEKRAAVRRAAQQAGIEILALISEPTAAFIACAEELSHCRYLAIFDWGGGTLDISILEVRDGLMTEIYAGGWSEAGDDIDRHFAEWLHRHICRQRGMDLSFSSVAPRERQELLALAEELKCELRERSEASASPGNYAGQLTKLKVRQSDFDSIVRPIVERAVDRLFECVKKAGIAAEEVNKLVLVGGSSKLRLLHNELNRLWPHPYLTPGDAEWAIAKGAALLAANPGSYRLAESLGLVLGDGEYHPIFPNGTPLEETWFDLHFGLVEDTRTASFVFATQSRDERTRQIGELHIDTFGFLDEVIELKSRISEDLVLEAVAKSLSQGTEQRRFTYDRLRWMYELPNGHH